MRSRLNTPMTGSQSPVLASGTFTLAAGGADPLTVRRLGFGAMRITGAGIWGDPPDKDTAIAVLRRAVELGVDFIDTTDAYGPDVSEDLIREHADRSGFPANRITPVSAVISPATGKG